MFILNDIFFRVKVPFKGNNNDIGVISKKRYDGMILEWQ